MNVDKDDNCDLLVVISRDMMRKKG